MKLLKKFILSFIVLLLIYTLINTKMMENVKACNEENYGDVHLFIDNPDNITLTNIEIEIYLTEPIIEGNKIIRYEHTLYDSILLTDKSINIKKPSECVLFKILLETLPNNTGVLNNIIFIQKDESFCEIKFREIFNVETSLDENGNIYPVITSKYGEKLYAETDSHPKNIVDAQINNNKNITTNFSENSNQKEKENILNNDTVSYSYYPENYQSNDNRFYVQYDPNTMSETNAIIVYNAINEISNFFGSYDVFSSVLPETDNNKFLIQLQNQNNTLNSNNNAAGVTISSRNNDGTVCSWIILQYDLLTNSNTAYNNYYMYVLAHEYFHALISEIADFDNSLEFQYLNESLAAFAGILFMSDKNLQSEQLKIDYKELAQRFIKSNNIGFSNYKNGITNQYSGFLFPLYLYKKYGMGIINDVLEEYISDDTVQDLYHYVLCDYNTTFRKTFIDFSNAILFLDVNFSDVIIPYYLSSWSVAPINSLHEQFNNGSYSQQNLEIKNYSNLLISNKVDVCNIIEMLCTIELENRNNSIIIYGTKDANNNIETNQMNVQTDLVTIPCNDYCSPSNKEWRCFVNSNSASEENTIVNYNVQFKHKAQSLSTGNIKDATSHFHKKFNEVLYEYVAHSTAVYEVTIDTINEYNVSPNGMVFTLYDSNNNILASTNGIQSNDFRTAIHLYAKMEVNKKYYLKINYLSNQAQHYTKCLVSINNFSNEVTLNNQTAYIYNDNTLKQLNNGIYIHSSLNQTYNISLTFKNINTNTFNCSLYVLIGNDLILLNEQNINSNNLQFNYSGMINKNYKYYILITGVPKLYQSIVYDLNINV